MAYANHLLYRKLPQTGDLLCSDRLAPLRELHSRERVTAAVRTVLAGLRQQIKEGEHTEATLATCLDEIVLTVEAELAPLLRPSLRRVINATGVLLQTNLGRAPLSEAAMRRMQEVAQGYCNLEFDLESGARSRRDVHAEQLILEVLAARGGLPREDLQKQAAAVVNNCAAATFLALNTLAEGGEVIVSRGELVEIGGGFRVPDILRKSGAVLREVGTTNRTRLADYAAAITPQTRLILRVHRSNFRIEGFTEQPSLRELVELGTRNVVPVFEDQGTGCVVDLNVHGLRGESSWLASIASGAALVACSGDKLLGGPQCGLLVGDAEIVERVRTNPLFRVLRVDKLTYAALQATLLAYLAGEDATIPLLAMLNLTANAIRQRCEVWAEALSSASLTAEVKPTESVIGGGTTPGACLPSYAVALEHTALSETALAKLLRNLDPPVVARIHEGRVLLDLRTVAAAEDATLIELLQSAMESIATSGPEHERGPL